MKSGIKQVEGLGKTKSLIEVINYHRIVYGKEVIEELVDLAVGDLHPFITEAMVHLAKFAKYSSEYFRILFSAVIYGGTFRLFNLLNQDEMEELRLWIDVAPKERRKSHKFNGLKSPVGQGIRLQLDKEVFHDCKQIAESLGLQQPEAICILAFVAGMLEVDKVSKIDRICMFEVIGYFDEWIHMRVGVLRRRYDLDEAEFTRRRTGIYRLTDAGYIQEPRTGIRPNLSRKEAEYAVTKHSEQHRTK
jgi:hypothetical protein